jgi:hypothetical protein
MEAPGGENIKMIEIEDIGGWIAGIGAMTFLAHCGCCMLISLSTEDEPEALKMSECFLNSRMPEKWRKLKIHAQSADEELRNLVNVAVKLEIAGFSIFVLGILVIMVGAAS